MRFDHLDHPHHHLLRLAHCQTAHRIAFEVHTRQCLRAALAQQRHRAALHDAEHGLAVLHSESGLAAFGPAQGQFHCLFRHLIGARQFDTFIQLHLDIGAEQALDFNRAFRCQFMLGAVDMRAEHHALLVELAQFGQRHHLKTTRIRQNRVWPAHHMVQAAETGDPFGPRPQHQMIDIAQHHIGACGAHLIGIHGLHSRRRADRHESGCADFAARHGDAAPPRLAGTRQHGEPEIGRGHRSISGHEGVSERSSPPLASCGTRYKRQASP